LIKPPKKEAPKPRGLKSKLAPRIKPVTPSGLARHARGLEMVSWSKVGEFMYRGCRGGATIAFLHKEARADGQRWQLQWNIAGIIGTGPFASVDEACAFCDTKFKQWLGLAHLRVAEGTGDDATRERED
jgi:hypothetical protein